MTKYFTPEEFDSHNAEIIQDIARAAKEPQNSDEYIAMNQEIAERYQEQIVNLRMAIVEVMGDFINEVDDLQLEHFFTDDMTDESAEAIRPQVEMSSAAVFRTAIEQLLVVTALTYVPYRRMHSKEYDAGRLSLVSHTVYEIVGKQLARLKEDAMLAEVAPLPSMIED